MVRFEKDRLTIEVYTGYNPVEDFIGLQQEIAHVFGMMTPDNMPSEGLYRLASLLAALQPDFSTASKMISEK